MLHDTWGVSCFIKNSLSKCGIGMQQFYQLRFLLLGAKYLCLAQWQVWVNLFVVITQNLLRLVVECNTSAIATGFPLKILITRSKVPFSGQVTSLSKSICSHNSKPIEITDLNIFLYMTKKVRLLHIVYSLMAYHLLEE